MQSPTYLDINQTTRHSIYSDLSRTYSDKTETPTCNPTFHSKYKISTRDPNSTNTSIPKYRTRRKQ